MRVDPRLFRCASCQVEWRGELLLECPINLAVRVMKAIRCPQCGKSKTVLLLYGEEAVAAAQRLAQAEAANEKGSA